MENKYLAKSEKDKPIEEQKTIKEHTEDLLKQYEILRKIYPNILNVEEWEILSYAVKFHDIGKINSKFQNKLYKAINHKERLEEYEGEEVPHNFLSPFFINGKEFKEKYGEESAKALISAVYYHHDREEVDYNVEVIEEELKKQVENFGDFFGLDLSNIKRRLAKYLIKNHEPEMKQRKYIMIKGLLNKLDYTASMDRDGVNVEEEIRSNGKTVADNIREIINGTYKGVYREVQSYMEGKSDENLIVVSPCGSGKTEAALLWLGESKGFYTLPLKVSINAIYERIYNQIKYDKTVLLHSDAFKYYEESNKNKNIANNQLERAEINSYYRARRLSSPLIVTTVDQLFRMVFRYNGYEEILATLSYSKVIIDEIQMYSPEIIAYILIGLKMITEVGGKFTVMTATFPDILYGFLDELEVKYTRQNRYFKSNIEKRHKIEVLEEQDFDIEKIKENAKNKKVLVIVNTIGKAQKLYEQLEEQNVHLLHSHYLKKDRKLLEDNIMEFTDRKKNQESGIWISTQIVEASLDIDFDVLFSDMSSIDSIFQRMGRIYRSREYLGYEPNIYIYDNKNGVGKNKIIDSDIYKYSLEEILKYNKKELSEQDKQNIITEIFDLNKNKKLEGSNYYKKIKENLRLFKETRPYEIEKSEVNRVFRNINSIELIPDNIYEELNNRGKIDEWNEIFRGDSSKTQKINAKDEISKYTINVTYTYYLDYDKQELFYPHSNIYRTSYIYDFDDDKLKGKGLIMEKEEENNHF